MKTVQRGKPTPAQQLTQDFGESHFQIGFIRVNPRLKGSDLAQPRV